MRLIPNDPDVQTLYRRIETGDINLQPEFQRGEVWGVPKKRRLIDTILRDWHIPPIHVVVLHETGRQEVLDGQQRLVAIREFIQGKLRVDGYADPPNEEIQKLNGLTYSELPDKFRRRFDGFTIRVFRLEDYEPSEPGELFYRLNQPTSLTAAEQRNAYFGPARNQVKELVQLFDDYGIDKSTLGFSNSRMAYDDVLARVCCTIEKGTLREKITALDITTKYRTNHPFPECVIERTERAISFFATAADGYVGGLKYNKATLYSWLVFLVRVGDSIESNYRTSCVGDYIKDFEGLRELSKSSDLEETIALTGFRDLHLRQLDPLFAVFTDRASARVNDVSSVLMRDIIIWFLFTAHESYDMINLKSQYEPVMAVDTIREFLWDVRSLAQAEEMFAYVIAKCGWGQEL